ncbi:MAG TPA: hypothetical protein VGN20_10455 [Mucilaginibacter sp.]
MKKTAFAFVIMLLCMLTAGYAQYSLRIQVNDFYGKPELYVTGSFNNWNPADKNYQLKRINYFRTEITLRNLPGGKYAFKITGGSLRSVETTIDGKDIPNHTVNVQRDTTVLYWISGWKDRMAVAKLLSASANCGRLQHCRQRHCRHSAAPACFPRH